VSVPFFNLRGIHWVIVGGESGPKARPMDPTWARDICKQCYKYDVAFFFKQWGAFNEEGERVGKKAAGRILDGKTWDEVPDLKLTEWSEDMIEETIRVFKPDADRLGQEFTRGDAIESLNNMVAFAECLIEMDRDLRKKEMPK